MRRKGRFNIKSNGTIKKCESCIINYSCKTCKGVCCFHTFKNGHDKIYHNDKNIKDTETNNQNIEEEDEKEDEKENENEKEEIVGEKKVQNYSPNELKYLIQLHNGNWGYFSLKSYDIRTINFLFHVKKKKIACVKNHHKNNDREKEKNSKSYRIKEDIDREIRKQNKIIASYGHNFVY